MRVIQDSDDEFEEDLENDNQPPPKTADAPKVPEQRAKDASSVPGTGSTESLKRAFTEAHRSHLRSPSPNPDVPSHEPQSSVFLPDQRSKKRKTFADGSPRMSCVKTSPLKEFGNEARLVGGTTTMPGGMISQGSAQHDTITLYPAPSSTIPNATLTQQRLLQGVAPPAFLGLESEADEPPRQFQPQASLPWSDIIDFSPADNTGLPVPCDQQAEPEPSYFQGLSGQLRKASTSQQESLGPDIRLEGSPFRAVEPTHNDHPETIEAPSHAVPSSQDLGLPPPPIVQENAPKKDWQSSHCQMNTTHPEHDLGDDLIIVGLPKEQYNPRPSRSRSLKIDIQEPVDYSIRPEKALKADKRRRTTTTSSVTRSTKAENEPTTPQKVQRICGMGFTPVSTSEALKQHNGDVNHALDWLIDNDMGKDELAPHDTPKKQSGSKVSKRSHPKHLVDCGMTSTCKDSSSELNTVVKETAFSEDMAVATKNSTKPTTTTGIDSPSNSLMHSIPVVISPQVQVVIPAKSPRAASPQKLSSEKVSPKTGKRRKTTQEVPDLDSALSTPIAPEIIVEKKKGRGRPKKQNKAPLAADTTLGVPKEGVREHGKELSEARQEIESYPDPLPAKRSDDEKPTTDTMYLQKGTDIEAPTSISDKPSPPVTRCVRDESAKASNYTPASKGSYRVGLSKRARIAPLLRILKK